MIKEVCELDILIDKYKMIIVKLRNEIRGSNFFYFTI